MNLILAKKKKEVKNWLEISVLNFLLKLSSRLPKTVTTVPKVIGKKRIDISFQFLFELQIKWRMTMNTLIKCGSWPGQLSFGVIVPLYWVPICISSPHRGKWLHVSNLLPPVHCMSSRYVARLFGVYFFCLLPFSTEWELETRFVCVYTVYRIIFWTPYRPD